MDEDTRHFQSIKIGMTHVETGKERFTTNGITRTPPICPWRNNITALSQHWNLYFVASQERVAVYVPSFPFQQLGRAPALLITPSLAEPTADGYIDGDYPHGINHLKVGELGTEEILLLARDSGNVEAYYTSSIHAAVLKNTRQSTTLPKVTSDEAGVRPFFSQWVHESAWGLAIHKQGRMVAISANVPHHVPDDDESANLVVFAFALKEQSAQAQSDNDCASDDGSTQDEEDEWNIWTPRGSERPSRDRNYKIMLRGVDEGHLNNCPDVSFINTPQDKYGDWLLSTDIGGQTKAWKIWQARCYKTWDFSERYRAGIRSHGRRAEIDRGWIVAALDPAAFGIVETEEKFCGWTKAPLYQGHITTTSWDITNIVRSRVPSNSQFHPLSPYASQNTATSDILRHDPVDQISDGEVLSEMGTWRDESDSDDQSAERDMAGAHRPDAPRTNAPAMTPMLTADGSGVYMIHEVNVGGIPVVEDGNSRTRASPHRVQVPATEFLESEEDDSSSSDDDADEDGQFSESRRSSTSMSSLHRRRNTDDVENDSEDEPAADHVASNLAASSSPPSKRQRVQFSRLSGSMSGTYLTTETRSRSRDDQVPPVPILHCSASHVRLLQGVDSSTPHYFCASILKQLLPDVIMYNAQYHLDRLNMFQQVPELGIVVIGTQLGRCAVCSLTRKGPKGPVGFRVDWVLPTKTQEQAKLRSSAPLLGIAIGPIQGRFPPAEPPPRSEHDDQDNFATDRTVGGTRTTFRHTVVKPQGHRSADSSAIVEDSDDDSSPRCRRKRPPRRREVRTEQKAWTKPVPDETFRSTENSRRYRLMLTYYDFTVMTYEIWREAPDVGIDPTRRNHRNRDILRQDYGQVVVEET